MYILKFISSITRNSFVTYHFKKHGQTVQKLEMDMLCLDMYSDGSNMCGMHRQQILKEKKKEEEKTYDN